MKKNSFFRTFWQDVHIRETIKGGGVFFFIKIVGTFGAYLFALYISRVYGPEGNGIMAFTLTLAVLLASVYNLGLNTYAVKIIPQFQEAQNSQAIKAFYRKALSTIGIITFTGTIVMILLSYMVASESLSRDLFLVGFLTIPVSMLLFISHTFKARKRMFGFSLLQNNILQMGALGILLLPLWTRINPSEPVLACVLGGVIMTVFGLFTNRIGRKSVQRLKSFPFSSHVRESLPMLAGGLAFMILNLTDRLMLRFLGTTAQLGIYDIVLRLSNLILLGIISLNAMAEPKFAEFHARNNLAGLRRFVGRMTWGGILISLPVLLLLGLFPVFWLGFFGQGDDFLAGRTSLYILLIGQFISVMCGEVLMLLNMTGHQRSVQVILLTAAFLNIVLNAILIPLMGIDGAAWATTISTIVWNIWAVWAVRRKLGFWMWSD